MRRASWLSAALCLSCGPQVSEPAGDGDGSTTAESTSTTGASGSTAVDSTGSVDTSGSTTADSDTGSTDNSGSSGEVDICTPGLGWVSPQLVEDDVGAVFRDAIVVDSDVIYVVQREVDPVYDTLLRRYDAEGNELWTVTAFPHSYGRGARLSDGDLVLCGGSSLGGVPLARFSSDGVEQWAQMLPDEWCNTLVGDPNGGFVIAALDYIPDRLIDEHVDRRAGDGTLSWRWDLTEFAEVNDVATVGDDVIVIGGDIGGDVVWIVRLDGAGQELWSTAYEDPAFEARWGRRAVVDPSGDIIVAGEVEVDDPRFGRDRDIMLWRYSADGELLWSQQHDFGNPRDALWGLVLAPDGSIVISGWTGIWRDGVSANYGLLDVLLASFSADGQLLWSDTLEFGDAEMDIGLALAPDHCGGFFVAGGSWEDDEHANRPWFGRYMP